MDHLIVVLTYNRARQAQSRMDELTRLYASRPDVSLVLYDNGSTQGEMKLVRATAEAVRVYRREDNIGFARGFNSAVRCAREDEGQREVLHLVSDDVMVAADFLPGVEAVLLDRPRSIVCHRLVDWQAGWNQFAAKRIPYPDGYYLAMRVDIWDELGGFDEDFAPYDYEDVDLGYRATRSGIALAPVTTLPLMHQPASTIGYGADRYEQTVRMRALFADKHGLTNTPERP